MTSTLPVSSKSVIQAHQAGTETPINVDAQEYMQDAAWWATPDKFDVVKNFFENPSLFSNGTYTEKQIIDTLRGNGIDIIYVDAPKGDLYFPDKHNFLVGNHKNFYDAAKDAAYGYEDRSFIFSTARFALAPETRFVVEDGVLKMTGTSVIPVRDDYDYVSDTKTVDGANKVLKPFLDSEGTGKAVPIEFLDRGNIPPYQSSDIETPAGEYTVDDYNEGKAATEDSKVLIVKSSLIEHVKDLLTDTDISSFPEEAEGAAGTLAGIALGAAAIASPPFAIGALIALYSQAFLYSSPLVLDLDGDGIEVTNMGVKAVFFDVNYDGFAEKTAWITGGDGLLALDINSDGIINDGSELFGNQTGYDNGFLALAAYDSNDDGQITSEDMVWDDLRVWVDWSMDGYSDAGELFSLSAINITEINLAYSDVSYQLQGNNVFQDGSFVINSNSHDVADVYFKTDPLLSVYNQDYELDAAALLLPHMRGYGVLPDLYIAGSIDNDDESPDSLISLVTGFSELTTAEIFAADTVAMDAVRELMFRWADADGVNPTSRGPYMDARELAFLEAMTGQPFLQQGYRADPYRNAAADLKEAFALAHNHVFATLAAQTAAGEIFTGDFYYNIATDSFTGITGLDTSVLDGLETSASGLANTAARELFWSNVVRVVEFTVGTGNLDGTSLAALEAAITGSDVALDTDYILALLGPDPANEINGTGSGETLNGTSGDDMISAFGGDDTINAGAGDDDVFAGNGNDVINGGTGDDFLSGGSGNNTFYAGAGNDGVVGRHIRKPIVLVARARRGETQYQFCSANTIEQSMGEYNYFY